MAERGEGKHPEECGCGISFGKTHLRHRGVRQWQIHADKRYLAAHPVTAFLPFFAGTSAL